MQKAAVLGYPISHSLSPKLHGYWLEKYRIMGSYEAIEVKPENLSETVTQLMDKGYSGANLTIPLKEKILPLLDEISAQAQQIGAVNTVVFQEGKLLGSNTDAYGFIENLRQGVKGLDPYLSHAVILGAGGAARAVISGLLAEGVEHITLLNRTRDKAEILAKMDSKIIVRDWEKMSESLSQATMLVNSTSLGMKNQPALELDLKQLPTSALVTDVVYNPLETPLLKQLRVRGNPVVDGLGMLIYQAVPAFEAFFGQKPEANKEIRGILQ